MNALRLLPVALLIAAGAAPARPKIGDSWPIVGFDREASCELALRSNPVAIRMEASGLIPGETLRLVIRNGAMKPLRLTVRANAEGRYSDYYAPLKSNYGASPSTRALRSFGAPLASSDPSGQVDIELAAARCTLAASSPWTTELRIIP